MIELVGWYTIGSKALSGSEAGSPEFLAGPAPPLSLPQGTKREICIAVRAANYSLQRDVMHFEFMLYYRHGLR